MTTKEFIQIEEKYGAHNYHPLDVVLHKAKAFGFTMLTEKNIWIASQPTPQLTRGTAIQELLVR